VAFNYNRIIGIVGQVGGGYKHVESHLLNEGFRVDLEGDLKLHELMAGLRLTDRSSSRVVWFGQLLLGANSTSGGATVVGTGAGLPTIRETVVGSETHFGVQAGAGVILKVTNAVGVGLDADLQRMSNEGEAVKFFRFAGGIVLPFGRK
jgi:hypothetical protein